MSHKTNKGDECVLRDGHDTEHKSWKRFMVEFWLFVVGMFILGWVFSFGHSLAENMRLNHCLFL